MHQFTAGQHVHFVGIGGYGLSAIARILLERGCHVTGSDRAQNALAAALARDGAAIYEGHDAACVDGAEVVIMSSAVPADHVEVLAARSQGIPVYKRSQIIAAVMAGQLGIAVAGTHGKTTTSSMITHVLREAGASPSYIVGGILGNTGTNAGTGTGPAFVIEADEYDNMFHGLRPQVAVVTNLEYDHPDFFQSPAELQASFAGFVDRLTDDGLLLVCADDAGSAALGQSRAAAGLLVQRYGIHAADADWQARNLLTDAAGTHFDVYHQGQLAGSGTLGLPGDHNVLNALAAVAVAHSQGLPVETALRGLASFKATGRRFDVRGDTAGIAVIDDYAHHPTAICATLAAARQRYPDRSLWAVWQPHTYSRLRHLHEDFLVAFTDADHVLVLDVFAAREHQAPDDHTGASMVAAMQHSDVRHTPQLADAVAALQEKVRAPAAVLVFSAGDAIQISEQYWSWLRGVKGAS